MREKKIDLLVSDMGQKKKTTAEKRRMANMINGLISILVALGHCAMWKYCDHNWIEGVSIMVMLSGAVLHAWMCSTSLSIVAFWFLVASGQSCIVQRGNFFLFSPYMGHRNYLFCTTDDLTKITMLIFFMFCVWLIPVCIFLNSLYEHYWLLVIHKYLWSP